MILDVNIGENEVIEQDILFVSFKKKLISVLIFASADEELILQVKSIKKLNSLLKFVGKDLIRYHKLLSINGISFNGFEVEITRISELKKYKKKVIETLDLIKNLKDKDFHLNEINTLKSKDHIIQYIKKDVKKGVNILTVNKVEPFYIKRKYIRTKILYTPMGNK